MAARDPFSQLQETRLAPGDVVADRFRITGFLGRGGMGEVYEAEHRVLRKQVALKLLRARRSDRGPGATERLLREARAASQLSSPHAIRILDAGVAGETAFIAMELLDGADLAALIAARGRLSREESVAVLLEACDALGEAHEGGIVHRDVKPSNLFLARNPRGGAVVKVLDFGVAKLLLEEVEGSATITGSVIGSPRYMSPEQIRDPRKIDARTDVWSLGITLHELVTGRAPFDADFPSALCAMVTSEPPTISLEDGDMPGLSALVLRCLEKDREARFADAKALAAALREIAGGKAALPAVFTARERVDESTATPAPAETEGSAVIARERRPSAAPRFLGPWMGAGVVAVAVAAIAAAILLGGASDAPQSVAARAPSPPQAAQEPAQDPARQALVTPPTSAPTTFAPPTSAPAAPSSAVPSAELPSAPSSSPVPKQPTKSAVAPARPSKPAAPQSADAVDEREVLKNRD